MANENISQMLCLIDDIKQDIPDQKYIDIMKSLTQINKDIERKSNNINSDLCWKVGIEYYQHPDNESWDNNYYYNIEDAYKLISKLVLKFIRKPFNNEMYALKLIPYDMYEDDCEYMYEKIDIEENTSIEEFYEKISYLVSTSRVNMEQIEIIQFNFKDDELYTDDGIVHHKDHDLGFNAEEYYHRVISVTRIPIS